MFNKKIHLQINVLSLFALKWTSQMNFSIADLWIINFLVVCIESHTSQNKDENNQVYKGCNCNHYKHSAIRSTVMGSRFLQKKMIYEWMEKYKYILRLFPVWIRNQLISAVLEQVLRHTSIILRLFTLIQKVSCLNYDAINNYSSMENNLTIILFVYLGQGRAEGVFAGIITLLK